MSKKKPEKPELTRADLEREIARMSAINRDLREHETRVRLSRAARENERLREQAGMSPVQSTRPIVSIADVRAREARTAREAARDRLDFAETRVALLRDRVTRGDTSTPTIASLARADAEARDARIALARLDASASAGPAPGVAVSREARSDVGARAESLRKVGYR